MTATIGHRILASDIGGGGGGPVLVPPTPATFPNWLNRGPDLIRSNLVSTAGRGLKATFLADRSTSTVRGATHDVPAAGIPWRVTACLDMGSVSWTYQALGLVRSDSVSGKTQQMALMTTGTSGVTTQHEIHDFTWTGFTSVTDALMCNLCDNGGRIWLRFTDTGASDTTATLWELSRSGDPDDWYPILGGARTDALGAVPTEFGIGASCYSGNLLSAPDPTAFIRHYEFTHG